jgi:plasmid stabilization system protein ParE
MVTIFWTTQAEEALKEIFDYIANGSRKYAFIQIQKTKQAPHLLKTTRNPRKTVTEYKNPCTLELIEGNYRLTYKVKSENQIDILLVHHGARDFSRRPI